MKIGIMSDSHDHLGNIEKIVTIFKNENVNALMHCGDYCSPFVARKMGILEGIPFYGVRGNNDGDISFLNTTFAKLGAIKEPYQRLDIEGRKILLFHGHAIPEEHVSDIARGGAYDIIVYGHYHHVRNEIIGNTLVLNPGESSGYLNGEATAMILILMPTGKTDVKIIKV